MTTRLLTGEGRIWPKLTKAAKKASKGEVAVAYFGTGGANRLPLGPGSTLVVNAGTDAIEGRTTNPRELLKLYNELDGNIAIYSNDRLHGKVFVFGRTAYVGSTNCSKLSSGHLAEAVMQTTDPETLRDAKAFVRSSRRGPKLGPARLKELIDQYDKAQRQHGPSIPPPPRVRVWCGEVREGDIPDRAFEQSERSAEAAESKRHYLDEYHYVTQSWRPGKPKYREGDIICMWSHKNGKRMMDPPGVVIHVEPGDGERGSMTITETEHSSTTTARDLHRIASSLGSGWMALLRKGGRGGWLPKPKDDILVDWWKEKGA